MKKNGESGLIGKGKNNFSLGLQDRDNRRRLRLIGSSQIFLNYSVYGLRRLHNQKF
jgi:hypothetical protein